MDISQIAPDRRTLLLGLLALGGCASDGRGRGTGLPPTPFSLTVWAVGPALEFVLLNVSETPIEVVSPFDGVPPLEVMVQDDQGAVLTSDPARSDGFISLGLSPVPPQGPLGRTRRVAPFTSLTGAVSNQQLLSLLRPRLSRPLAEGGRYWLSFGLPVWVVDRAGQPHQAQVRSRSSCSWTLAGGIRAECVGPR